MDDEMILAIMEKMRKKKFEIDVKEKESFWKDVKDYYRQKYVENQVSSPGNQNEIEANFMEEFREVLSCLNKKDFEELLKQARIMKNKTSTPREQRETFSTNDEEGEETAEHSDNDSKYDHQCLSY